MTKAARIFEAKFPEIRLLQRLAALVPALLAAYGLAACSRPVTSVPDTLAIPINLRCTTCDDFIACREPNAVPDPQTGRTPTTVYRLKEKTFWAQIATIGDYLTQLWREKTTDERPLAIYRDTGAERAIEEVVSWRATIDATNRSIGLPDGSIGQADGVWRALDGSVRGQCAAMQRRAGYSLVREYLGKPPLPIATPR
jgi:hypothetical protein